MTATLTDVCSDVVDCINRTAPESVDGDYYIVGTPAMRGNSINYSEARRVDQEVFAAWNRRLQPREGDLLIAREAPVGPVVRIPAGGHVGAGQRTTLLRPNPDIIDARFLFYYLTLPATQSRFVALGHGSTTPHVRVEDVRNFSLPRLPDRSTQRAIAEVLGALDDKIAANEQITSLVQQAAATLFVARVAAGELTTKTYADIADVGGGGTPSTREASYWDGGVNWASPTDITALSAPYLDATAKTITDEGLRAGSSPLYPEMSVLMTSRATIGAFAMTIAPTTVNQGFIVAQAKDPAGAWWLFHEMQTRIDNYRAYANGATFLELPRGRFKALSVEWPSDSELRLFHDVVDPLHRRAYAAMVESRKLAALRDALLPELMSGGLTVKDAETQVEEVV